MNKHEREFINCKSPSKNEKSNLKEKFDSARRKFDKELRKKARQYNYMKIEDIENMATDNPTIFWNQIKNMGPRKKVNIPLVVNIDGQETSDIEEVKMKWKNDFETLLNPKEETLFDKTFCEEAVKQKMRKESEMLGSQYEANMAINYDVSLNEIEDVIAKLKARKASGPDSIVNEVIRCNGFKNILWKLISVSYKNSIVPSVWKTANIKPIPKGSSKDPYVPGNYRGISLISCVAKCFSSFLNIRLTKYCNGHGLLAEEQNGFRSNRSCEDHIFVLNSIVENRLNDKKPTYCAFIDLEKAFDWINRDLLLYKLIDLGIDGNIYFAIKSMLSGTRSKIILGDKIETMLFEVSCGVRQGDPMSPTLFSLFINDLITHLKTNCNTLRVGNLDINSLFYADDMVLIGESENDLQNLLDELNIWCMQWHVKINEDKSKIVHFRKVRTKCTEIDFLLNGQMLEKVNCYKYLGVYFDEHLKFDICIRTLAESAGRALGSIINKFKSLKNVGYNTFTKLYKCGVMPIMQYGSSVWGFKKAPEMDCIQNRAMRYFLGTHKHTPIVGMLGDMGWYKLSLERNISALRLWNRICQMDDTRLTKIVFQSDVERCDNNWGARVKLLLEKLGHTHQFVHKQVVSLDDSSCILRENEEIEWKNAMKGLPKLRTYSLFKTAFGVEDYVQYSMCRQKRSYMAQFRLGILPINVEIGRFRNIALEERKCEKCTTEIEDEIHFLLDCSLYKPEREKLFGIAAQNSINFINFSKDDKFRYLMQNVWKDTARFIVEAYKKEQGICMCNKMYCQCKCVKYYVMLYFD